MVLKLDAFSQGSWLVEAATGSRHVSDLEDGFYARLTDSGSGSLGRNCARSRAAVARHPLGCAWSLLKSRFNMSGSNRVPAPLERALCVQPVCQVV